MDLWMIEKEELPISLKNIKDTPLKIYGFGDKNILESSKIVAIVGTRNASKMSLDIAKSYARILSKYGFIIVSGLAYGIDSEVHRGVIESGKPQIAVLPSNPKNIYPKGNINIARQILRDKGCVISETSEITPLMPYTFLKRNRIVAGLSKCVIVIEAPKNSGSINTANHAMNNGRDVFVVPGGIRDFRYEGSNELIKDGAMVTTSEFDILSYYGVKIEDVKEDTTNLSKEEEVIFKIIKDNKSPIHFDDLYKISDLEVGKLSVILSSLVINNTIKEVNSMYFCG